MSSPDRGTVVGIRVHPVKAEPGTALERVEVTAVGLSGDRPKKSAVHLVPAEHADSRANLVLALSADDLFAVVGRRLQIGEVELAVTGRPSGCPGVYADVVRSGSIALGDLAVVSDGVDAAGGDVVRLRATETPTTIAQDPR